MTGSVTEVVDRKSQNLNKSHNKQESAILYLHQFSEPIVLYRRSYESVTVLRIKRVCNFVATLNG